MPIPAWAGSRRSALNRALRLIATAGTAAGGMCLVLAMVAWVTTMGAPHGHGHPGETVLVGRTLATYRGADTASRRHFQVSRPGNWGISWEFSCPAGQHGTFAIKTDNDNDSDGRERVNTSGSAGHGIYWYSSDPGNHFILITSSCPWTVRVVLARPPERHPGPSSPPGNSTRHGHHYMAARHGPKVRHGKPEHQKKPKHQKKREHRKKRKHRERTGHGQ